MVWLHLLLQRYRRRQRKRRQNKGLRFVEQGKGRDKLHRLSPEERQGLQKGHNYQEMLRYYQEVRQDKAQEGHVLHRKGSSQQEGRQKDL